MTIHDIVFGTRWEAVSSVFCFALVLANVCCFALMLWSDVVSEFDPPGDDSK